MKPAVEYVAAHLKDMNRREIFGLFREKRVLSRTQARDLSAISMPTQLKIFSFLQERGIIRHAGQAEAPLGRRAQLFEFDPDSLLAIGVELEGDLARAALMNLDGDIKAMEQSTLGGSFEETLLHRLPELAGRLLLSARGSPQSRLVGLGIAIPGVVNNAARTISHSTHLNIHRQADYTALFHRLEQAIRLPVLMANDVNAAAFGESRGPDSPEDLLFVLYTGEGLGAGLVLDGKPRLGPRMFAGEIGFITYDAHFDAQASQTGWFEDQLSAPLLKKRWHFSPHGMEALSGEQLGPMLEHITDLLALCVTNLAIQLDIPRVVVGGAVPQRLGEPFYRMLGSKVDRLNKNRTLIQPPSGPHPLMVGIGQMVFEEQMPTFLAD